MTEFLPSLLTGFLGATLWILLTLLWSKWLKRLYAKNASDGKIVGIGVGIPYLLLTISIAFFHFYTTA